MKTITHFLPKAAVACGLLMLSAHATAQTTTTTTERWKGCNVESLTQSTLKKDKNDNTTGEIETYGTRFWLYNVGTGKFIAASGEYGTEAYVLYQDFGTAMTLTESGAMKGQGYVNVYPKIDGIAKGHNDDDYPYCLGINYPGISSTHEWSETDQTYGPILNAGQEGNLKNKNDWYRRYTKFVRVEDASNTDTYTYYIEQVVERKKTKNGDWNDKKTLYLGAYVGHDPKSSSAADVAVGKDRVTFTENGENAYVVQSTDFYKWRLVTEEEMEKVAKAENADNYGGLLANVSYLVQDPFFDVSRSVEFNTWTVTNGDVDAVNNNTTTENDKVVGSKSEKEHDKYIYHNEFRYAWPAGEDKTVDEVTISDKDKNGNYGTYEYALSAFTEKAPWNAPILRKMHFASQQNGKYAYAMLEGNGTAQNSVKVPNMEGYYMITCRGVASSEGVKLFAKSGEDSQEIAFPVNNTYGQKIISYNNPDDKNRDYQFLYYSLDGKTDSYDWKWKGDDESSTWHSFRKYYSLKNPNGDCLLSIGKALYNNELGEISIILKVGANDTITYGVEKTNAKKSTELLKVEWQHHINSDIDWTVGEDVNVLRQDDYYYDTEFAAFDNFQIYYLGQNAPFLLNEEAESDQYIRDEFNEIYTPTSGAKSGTQVKKNSNITTYLKRKFTVGKWNSFVLPVSMNAVQVRQFFGDDTKLAKLVGPNYFDSAEGDNKYYIDFQTVKLTEAVDITGNGTTVEKPIDGKVIEAGKMYIIKPQYNAADRYYLKQTTNNGKETTTTETVADNCYLIGRYDYTVDMTEPTQEWGTTDKGKIAFNGTYHYRQQNMNDSYAKPQAGSYVFGTDGELYHLTSAIDIKGFRGWLTAYGPDNQVKALNFGFDNSTTFIDGVADDATPEVGNIYTINGQLVRSHSNSTDGLPKGIYIVNGKKVVVK